MSKDNPAITWDAAIRLVSIGGIPDSGTRTEFAGELALPFTPFIGLTIQMTDDRRSWEFQVTKVTWELMTKRGLLEMRIDCPFQDLDAAANVLMAHGF